MNRVVFVFLLGCLLQTVAVFSEAAQAKRDEVEKEFIPHVEYKNTIEAAFRAYNKGDFPTAFENMSKSARYGDKHSQFMLALMYVFGDGTDIDFVTGMAWLEVANEAPNPKWRRNLGQLRNEATQEEIESASSLAQELKGLYGMAANEITCSRRPEIGSNVSEAICVKRRRPDGVSVEVPAEFPL